MYTQPFSSAHYCPFPHVFLPKDNRHFDTLDASFISLFVCLTTANFPDVMMPSYERSRWSPLFFILFLGVGLYFLQNLLLAVAIEHFGKAERTKFRKLFCHTRKALRMAFLAASDSGAVIIFCGEGLKRVSSIQGIIVETTGHTGCSCLLPFDCPAAC